MLNRNMADYSGIAGTAPVLAHPSTFGPTAATALPAGTPVSIDATSGEAVKAQANAAATANCAGLCRFSAAAGDRAVVQYGDVLELTTAQWDAVTGGSGGLTPNARYYVSSATAGLITATPPVSEGTFVSPVGLALSATELLVTFAAPIVL